MGLLGWGRTGNVAEGVAEPLFARAMFVEDERGARVAYVCADLCFVSVALREAVLARLASEHAGLGVGAHTLMLTATHTHSGPSGFSHAFFYDLAGPGFSQRVFATLVRGIVSAIALAAARAEPGRLTLATTRIPCAEPIAFNRSLAAYARNAEVRGRAITAENAVDRTLTSIIARDLRGRALGALSLFALHATSVHGDHRALHSDHKGLAALELEAWARARGASDAFVAIFGQGAAGDVTPNHRYDAKRGVTVGRFDDDHDSAAFVARVQAQASASLFEIDGEPIEGPVGGRVAHVDFGPGRIGVAMAEGTREGPGPLGGLRALSRLAHRARRGGDRKILLLDVAAGRRRRLFGRIDPLSIPIDEPAFVHARRARAEGGGVDERAWIPSVLPVGILRIGSLAIVGLPNEPTTMAGARIRRALAPRLASIGARRVHVQGYANAYSGYLTTPEEYDAQRYEGAYTLFGRGSLAAFTRALEAVADALARSCGQEPSPPIPLCTDEELRARRFRGG